MSTFQPEAMSEKRIQIEPMLNWLSRIEFKCIKWSLSRFLLPIM
jgi:hypothetical protein